MIPRRYSLLKRRRITTFWVDCGEKPIAPEFENLVTRVLEPRGKRASECGQKRPFPIRLELFPN